MNTKKYHMIIGILLMLFGIICTGFSMYNYVKPEITVNIKTLEEKSIKDCQQIAINNGFSSSRIGDELIMTSRNSLRDLNNPMPLVYKSTIVIEKCDNMHLISYCIGQECDQNFNFKMKFPK